MAAAVGKFAAQKLLRKQMGKYSDKKVETGDDPYFALIPDPKRPGKTKKVRKQIPAYLSENDSLRLARVRKSAYRLDMCLFNLFGIRFGWEAIIGLVPGFGDAVGVALAYLLFLQCCKIDGGLPSSVKSRMMMNIALDFVVGLVPFVGDLADAAFKCNTKNVRLLERCLDERYKEAGRDERRFVGVDRAERRRKRASGIYMPDDPPPATVFEDLDVDEDAERVGGGAEGVRRPEASRQGTGRGWFSRGGGGGGERREREHDRRRPEMAQETGSVRR